MHGEDFRKSPNLDPVSDTNGSEPDEVLAVILAQYDALSLSAESVGISLYAVGVASKKQADYDRQCRTSRLPPRVPLDTAMAADDVLDAASRVEHAYSVGGGWSVPLSLTLRELQRTVRVLRNLEVRDR